MDFARNFTATNLCVRKHGQTASRPTVPPASHTNTENSFSWTKTGSVETQNKSTQIRRIHIKGTGCSINFTCYTTGLHFLEVRNTIPVVVLLPAIKQERCRSLLHRDLAVDNRALVSA